MLRLLPLALLMLAACATTPAPTPIAQTQCLPLTPYTQAEQQAAAKELQALPKGSVLSRFITDYGAMRSADRACQETQGR